MRKYLFPYLLLILSLLASVATGQEQQISTIVQILKDGRAGQQCVVQGEIQKIDGANKRIQINDGTYHIWVYPTEKNLSLPFSIGDKLLMRGLIQSPFLQGNVVVAIDIQKLENLVPQATTVKPLSSNQSSTSQAEKPAAIPANDPNTVTPILNILTTSAASTFVNAIGSVQGFIEADVIVLQDATGKIPVLLQSEHQFLKLEVGEKLHLRAKVMQDENGAKSLFAVYLELPERKDDRPNKPTLSNRLKATQPSTTTAPLPKELPQPITSQQGKGPQKIISKSVIMEAEPTTLAPPKPAPIKKPAAKPKPVASAPATTTPTPKSERSFEERLELIKRLFDKGLITQDEFDAKRMEILSEL